MIRLKDGVDMDSVHPKIYLAIALADSIWSEFNFPEIWVTAAHEAGHHTNPDPKRQFHLLPDGTCQACDLRTHGLTIDEKRLARGKLANFLGPDYDVILESEGKPNEHIHIQYDPR